MDVATIYQDRRGGVLRALVANIGTSGERIHAIVKA